MGNPLLDCGPNPDVVSQGVDIFNFYTENSWIEGAATEQIRQVAAMDDVSGVSVFPDLHPGKFGPVGVAVHSHDLHPAFIGNDIGCGMAVYHLDLPVRKLRLDKAAAKLRLLSDIWDGNSEERLGDAGLPVSLFPTSLGTIGGGNHFCEIQAVAEVLGEEGSVDAQSAYLLIHTGSRGLGEQTFDLLNGEARLRIAAESPMVNGYLAGHDVCVAWARLNRRIVAERVADLLGCHFDLVCDVPHNLVSRSDNGFLHRKGAAVAMPGDIAPIAGSRASLSYLVRALPGVVKAFNSISHGAGRKYDRAAMHHRVGRTKSDRDALLRNEWGGLAICEDKGLLLEEAGTAYKSAAVVVDDLTSFGLVEPVAAMRPLITFKKANLDAADDDRRTAGAIQRRNERRFRRG
jgi:release factor H-coupled RctB family protein